MILSGVNQIISLVLISRCSQGMSGLSTFIKHVSCHSFAKCCLPDCSVERSWILQTGIGIISSDEFTQSLTCILRQIYDYVKVLDDAMYSSCSLHLDAIDYYPIAFGYNNNSRTS